MSALSVKSKDANEEALSTADDSDELQLVKNSLSVRDTAVEKEKKRKITKNKPYY
jgi:hypothetical protein